VFAIGCLATFVSGGSAYYPTCLVLGRFACLMAPCPFRRNTQKHLPFRYCLRYSA
jgi:hypothetical protein